MNIKDILKKIPLDNKTIILICLAVFFAAYLDFTYLLGAQLKTMKDTSAKAMKVKKEIEKLNKDLVSLKDAKQKLSGLTSRKAKRFISGDQVPALLKDISAIANANKVRIMQITPVKQLLDLKSTAAAALDAQGFSEISINMDISCGYHNLGVFINELENAEIFLAVDELKINSREDDYFNQDVIIRVRSNVKK